MADDLLPSERTPLGPYVSASLRLLVLAEYERIVEERWLVDFETAKLVPFDPDEPRTDKDYLEEVPGKRESSSP